LDGNYIPVGKTINALYIKKALAGFLVVSGRRRPSCSPRTSSCTGIAPQSKNSAIQEFLVAKRVDTAPHPLCLLDLATASFFFFPKVKSELAVL
jgi:hypothetical protein